MAERRTTSERGPGGAGHHHRRAPLEHSGEARAASFVNVMAGFRAAATSSGITPAGLSYDSALWRSRNDSSFGGGISVSDAFISYSHLDREFAVRLQVALNAAGKAVWVDESDILPTSRWADDLKGAIEDADTFILVLSPDSVASPECQKELSYASSLNKRIVPLVFRTVVPDELPQVVQDLQFLPPRGTFTDNFENSFRMLIHAVETDLAEVREHTEWGKKAIEWDDHSRDRSFLLSGSELALAEQWVARGSAKGPKPTDLQRAFLLASRQSATRRQRVVLGGVTVALLVAVVLGLLALFQRQHAINEADLAQKQATLSLSGELAAESATLMPNDVRTASFLSLASYAIAPTLAARDAMIAALEQSATSYLDDGKSPNAVAFSPDGKTIVSGDKANNVVFWNSASHKEAFSVGVGSPVTSATFSPDGKMLATAETGNVLLWNPATHHPTGQPLTEAKVHGSPVRIGAIAFSRDGRSLATGDNLGDIGLWNVATHTRVASAVDGSPITSVAFSPDGKTLAVGDSAGRVDFYNAETLDPTGSHSDGSPSNQDITYGVAFSPDGKTYATGDELGNVTVWDVATGLQVGQTLHDRSEIRCVAFSHDGRTLASGDLSGHVMLSDPATGVELGQPLGAGAVVNSVVFDETDDTLAAGTAGKFIDLWPTSQYTHRQTSGITGIRSIAVSQDGRTVATGEIDDGSQNALRVWRVGSPHRVREINDSSAIMSLAFNPKKPMLVAGSFSGYTTIWNLHTNQIKPANLPLPATGTWGLRSVAISPNGKILATGTSAGPVFWDLSTQIPIALGAKAGDNTAASVIFSRDDKTLIGGGDSGVTFWSTRFPYSVVRHIPDHGASVIAVALNRDGAILATGDSAGYVRLWNTRTGRQIRSFSDDSEIWTLAFSPDGKALATGDAAGNIVIWDPARGSQLARLTGTGSPVYDLTFTPNGNTLISTNGSVELTPTAYWRAKFGSLRTILCAKLSGNLTESQWAEYVPQKPYQNLCPAQ